MKEPLKFFHLGSGTKEPKVRGFEDSTEGRHWGAQQGGTKREDSGIEMDVDGRAGMAAYAASRKLYELEAGLQAALFLAFAFLLLAALFLGLLGVFLLGRVLGEAHGYGREGKSQTEHQGHYFLHVGDFSFWFETNQTRLCRPC